MSILLPQLLIFFCISPLLSVAAWHFGVLFSTLATPIAVILISRNTRDRMWLMYTCSGRKNKNAPQGSYAHTAKKYHDNAVEGGNGRRASATTMFSQELSSDSSDERHARKLSMIVEEPSRKPSYVECAPVEHHHEVVIHQAQPEPEFSKTPKLPNVIRSVGISFLSSIISIIPESNQPTTWHVVLSTMMSRDVGCHTTTCRKLVTILPVWSTQELSGLVWEDQL